MIGELRSHTAHHSNQDRFHIEQDHLNLSKITSSTTRKQEHTFARHQLMFY